MESRPDEDPTEHAPGAEAEGERKGPEGTDGAAEGDEVINRVEHQMARGRIVIPITAIALAASGLFVEAQRTALTPLAGLTETEIVASAEKEGAAFPVDPRVPIRQMKVFLDQTLPGAASRRCVPASGLGPFRSGQFVITGRLSGPRNKDNEIKVAWGPMHHEPKMNLVVRGRMVGSDETASFESSTVAYPVPNPVGGVSVPVPEAEREYFFPSGIRFVKAGAWVLVATHGSDWGCFVLNVQP